MGHSEKIKTKKINDQLGLNIQLFSLNPDRFHPESNTRSSECKNFSDSDGHVFDSGWNWSGFKVNN